MRLAGGVFLDGEMAGPWSVFSHFTAADAEPFFPGASHVISYNYVRAGWLTCQVGDQPPVPVRAGEIVILPRSGPHLLHGPVPGEPVNGHDVMEAPDADGLYRVRTEGEGEKTEVYCGFRGSTTPENMLLRALPPILVIDTADAARSDWIRRMLDFAVKGLGKDAPEMVGKLAEGLFVEAVRRYIGALPPDEGGWLAGLNDAA